MIEFLNEDNEQIKPVLDLRGSNEFMIIGRAVKALRKSGASERYVAQFMSEVIDLNYVQLVTTLLRYFDVRA